MKITLFFSVVFLVVSCQAAVQFNGLALLLLKDFDFTDVRTKQLSGNYKTLEKRLNSKVTRFRNASPHPTATFASYLTGRYPALLQISGKDNQRPSLGPGSSDRVILFKLLKDQGYEVGHFGEWPFSDSLGALVDRSFISHEPNKVADAVVEWINQVKQRKQKFFLSVLWPKSDLTFNVGGRYNPSDFRGAIGSGKGALCKDVQRVKSQPARYKTCARLIYLVNRRKDLALQNRVIGALLQVPNTFVGFSTVSGNESPLVDGKIFWMPCWMFMLRATL